MSYCQTPSGVVVVVVPGPKEAQGHTRNLLINSHNDNMLFTADGDKAEIGPDKLRVTGTPMAATCCVSLDVAHTCWWKGFGEKNEKIITLTTQQDQFGLMANISSTIQHPRAETAQSFSQSFVS